VLNSLASSRQFRGFVRADRIDAMPATRSRRLELLAEVAQIFEPGVRYPEPVVNEFLQAIHPDCAALRRYLVDEDFMGRANGEYCASAARLAGRPGALCCVRTTPRIQPDARHRSSTCGLSRRPCTKTGLQAGTLTAA
jgi:hypothetical protein